jgi:zinc ribbon protein
MRKCTNCSKQNPDDASYCLKCGNYLPGSGITQQPVKTRAKWYSRIPVLGWIALGVLALAGFLGIMIGGFWATATVEGFASVIFLVIGVLLFGVFRKGVFSKNSFFRAIAIGFWALMGACVDQTGNYFYNYPVGLIECSRGNVLSRHADVDHPYAGKTVITQDFNCYTPSGAIEKTVNSFAMMGYRFIEYIILAYLLIWLRQMVNYFRQRKHRLA